MVGWFDVVGGMVCFVFYLGSRVRGNDGWLTGLTRDEGFWGVFVAKFGHPPARCARPPPSRSEGGGRCCGEFRASLACCAWLARVFFAE